MSSEINFQEILWETNFNHKMDCQSCIHITIFPEGKDRPEPESLKTTIYTITTKDGSHKPIDVVIDDIIFLQVKDLLSLFTIPSHGMCIGQFLKYFGEKHPTATEDTPVMICTYTKPHHEKVYPSFRKIKSLNGNHWIV